MWIVKLFGILLIVASCSMAGFLKSRRVHNRAKKLRALCDGTALLFEYVEQGKYELKKAIKKAFFKCEFINFEKQNAICADRELNDEDNKLITDFLKSLGFSSKKAECDRIKAFGLILEKRLDEAHTEMTQKSKIYQAFGVCIGLAIGILLI